MAVPLFSLGRVVATPGALWLLANAGEGLAALLNRHQAGDWGEVSPEDARENELSAQEGFRILSSYSVGDHRLWIIAEADHSSTCILRPDEY